MRKRVGTERFLDFLSLFEQTRAGACVVLGFAEANIGFWGWTFKLSSPSPSRWRREGSLPSLAPCRHDGDVDGRATDQWDEMEMLP